MSHALHLEICLWVMAVRRCSEMEVKTEEVVGNSMCSVRHEYKAPVYLVHVSTFNTAKSVEYLVILPQIAHSKVICNCSLANTSLQLQ